MTPPPGLFAYSLLQYVLVLAGAVVAVAQGLAAVRKDAGTDSGAGDFSTLPQWSATPKNALLLLLVAGFCLLFAGALVAFSAGLIFPKVDFAQPSASIALVVAAQAFSLAALLGATKLVPGAFPPNFDAPPEDRSRGRPLTAPWRFGVPAFFALSLFAVTLGSLATNALAGLLPEAVGEALSEKQALVETLSGGTGPLAVALSVPAIVAFTPIIEEFIFRAGLYRLLKSRVGAVPAALGSSVIFALMHDAPASWLPLTLLGCVLCLAYEKTGRLAAPIVLHALFNANTLLGLALMPAP